MTICCFIMLKKTKSMPVFVLCVCINLPLCVCVCVLSGGCCRVQQSGRGAGGDHVLVGRVGQVDGLHSHLWRRSDDAGETLPQAEVSPSMCKANKQEKTTKPKTFACTKNSNKRYSTTGIICERQRTMGKISTEIVNKLLWIQCGTK